jgi:bifunctional DNA-binding transcriptional regulator/antitoxin component of YhaV-PrlF toxin-antitoxin module
MSKIGNVRRVDSCGRISIPFRLRRILNIDLSDPLEVQIDNDTIVLRKTKRETPKEEAAE